MELTSVKSIRVLLGKRWFQFTLQLPMTVSFFIIIAVGLFGSQFPDANLATIITWTIWWGGVIFTFLLAGRLWCAACPWAAVAEWIQRISFWRVNPQPLTLGIRWPVRLRNLYLMSVMFILITWAEFAFDLVTNPRNTAYLAIITLMAAVITAILFERRTFCRYICPIGGLMGVYSTCSIVSLKARDRVECRECRTKDCINGNENGYGCPVYEYPEAMETAFHCTLCSECVKTCPRDNISIGLRAPSRELADGRMRPSDEAIMAFLVAGITMFHGLTMIPIWFRAQEHMYYGWGISPLLVASVGLLVTLFIFGAFYIGFSLIAGGKGFSRLAFALIPLALFFHLGHNCLHLFGEAGKMLPALSDPFGWGWDILGIKGLDIGPLISVRYINVIQWGFIGAGVVVSILVALKRSEGEREKLATVVAIAVMTGVYSWMLTQPMVMRL